MVDESWGAGLGGNPDHRSHPRYKVQIRTELIGAGEGQSKILADGNYDDKPRWRPKVLPIFCPQDLGGGSYYISRYLHQKQFGLSTLKRHQRPSISSPPNH